MEETIDIVREVRTISYTLFRFSTMLGIFFKVMIFYAGDESTC